MNRKTRWFLSTCLFFQIVLLTACATVAGTAIGAGIGSISGNTGAGALIGGGVGMMVDVID